MNKQSNIESDMLPFTMRELVSMVMQRKTLALEDALYYIYSSDLYSSLLDEGKKMWYLSTLSLYETLEKEKTGKRPEKIAFRSILHRELSGNKKYICKRDFTTIFRI